MALNDTALKSLKPESKAYTRADGLGLVVFIQPNGRKWWRFRYRFNGKANMISLGTYPDVSLLEARERRDEARKLLAKGIDPSNQRKIEDSQRRDNEKNTFKVWAEKWIEHWRVDKSPRHVGYTQRRLERHVYPLIGSTPIVEIEAPMIADVMRAIVNEGANDVAKRMRETIGMIFRYAIADKTSMLKRNATNDIKPSDIIPPRQKTNYARISSKELPVLLRTIDNSDATAITRIAIKLIALTFVRTSELIGARWGEIHIEAKQWRIPAERMKMRSEHIVPLARQAIDLLEQLRPMTGETEYLFPNQLDYQKSMSNNTILKALERMGYKGRMTGHGFRGVASTILHEQGYDHSHIELQLAHSPRDAVSAAYNHALYIPQRAKMMQEWADYLDSIKNNIVPFNKMEA
jgi:integrase